MDTVRIVGTRARVKDTNATIDQDVPRPVVDPDRDHDVAPTQEPPRRPLGARVLRGVAIGVGVLALVLFAIVLARVTFTPQPASEDLVTGNTDPGSSIRSYLDRPEIRDAVRQVGGNLVLCAPLGVLLPVVSARLRGPVRILLTVGVVMLAVEFVQGWFILGRAFDIDDVILNATGALLAYVFVGRHVAARVHPRRTPWWRRRGRDRESAPS